MMTKANDDIANGVKKLGNIMDLYNISIDVEAKEINKKKEEIKKQEASMKAVEDIVKSYTNLLQTTVQNYKNTLDIIHEKLLVIYEEPDSLGKTKKLKAIGETLKSMRPMYVWTMWLEEADKKGYESRVEGYAAFGELYDTLNGMATGKWKPEKKCGC